MALQIRRGTEAQRASIVFALGELVFTTDSQKLYIGDGITQGGVNVLQSTFPQNPTNGLVWNTQTETVNFNVSALSQLTTTNVPEGTNKYYTTTRAVNDVYAALTSGTNTGITYSLSNGYISATVTGGGATLPPGGTTGKFLTVDNSGNPTWSYVPLNNNELGPLPSMPGNQGAYLTTDGTHLVWSTVAINTLQAGSHYITLDETNGNLRWVQNTDTGSIQLPALGDITKWNGTAYVSILNGLLYSVEGDTNPILGGNLVLNSHNITGTGNVNIVGTITASSTITGGSFSTSGTITASQGLGGDLSLNGHNITGTGNWSAGSISTQSLSATLGSNLNLGNFSITGAGSINITGSVIASSQVTGATGTFGQLITTTGLGGNLALNNYLIDCTGAITINGNISNGTLVLQTNTITTTGSPTTMYFKNSNQVAFSYNMVTSDGSGNSTPQFNLFTSRGTVGVPTNNAAGDNIASVNFGGYYNTGYVQSASLYVQIDPSANMSSSYPATNVAFLTGNNTSENVFAFLSSGIFSTPLISTNPAGAGTVYSAGANPLPTPSSKYLGCRAFVSDATANTWGANYVGFGSHKVPVWCDGTGWFVG